MRLNLLTTLVQTTSAALLLSVALASPARAADHGEAPLASQDRACDLADVYFFIDPNDDKNVVMALSIGGFIVPGENANFGFFDPSVRYRFLLDNTGRARGDLEYTVTFSPQTSKTTPQTATITLPDGRTFTAPTTISSATATENSKRTVTFDSKSQVRFFAGLCDDPFFFDIPASNRFIASVQAGAPDAATLQRGRDSFAGYNSLVVALEVPIASIRGKSTNNIVRISGYLQRRAEQFFPREFSAEPIKGQGPWVTVDRMGNPAVQVVLIPFAQDDLYNHATLQDDVKGKFAASIVTTLRSLGVSTTNINLLAEIAINHGDQLTLDLRIKNTGKGGGDNAGAGFPNGRRLKDDVVDLLFTAINNNAPLGDNVNRNDVPFRDRFPFFGYAQPPRAAGTVDDNTRN